MTTIEPTEWMVETLRRHALADWDDDRATTVCVGCDADIQGIGSSRHQAQVVLTQWAADSLEFFKATLPLYGVTLTRTWKPGERVELVSGGHGGDPRELRPGVVTEIREYLMKHEALVVKFDDGEERTINPDVMRHIR